MIRELFEGGEQMADKSARSKDTETEVTLDQVKALLMKLPDLERSVSRIHSYSLKKKHNEVIYGDLKTKKLKELRNTKNPAGKYFSIMVARKND